MKWVLALVVIAASGVMVVWAQSASGNLVSGTITVDGVVRSYLLHVPATYQPGAPLVLALHGGAGSARQFSRGNQLTDLSDQAGFILVYPDGLDRSWNDSREIGSRTSHDDVGFIRALIDQLSSEYSIDSRRVFVTGVSNGAMMSYRLACELADKIRAIAPVVGNLPVTLAQTCAPSQPVALHMIVGTNDPLVPYEGGGVGFFGGRGDVLSAPATAAQWASYNGCAAEPTVTQQSDLIEVTTYAGCQAPVEMLTVIGGGHDWYGRTTRANNQIDASTSVWAFFSSL